MSQTMAVYRCGLPATASGPHRHVVVFETALHLAVEGVVDNRQRLQIVRVARHR
jgi:hypothetical protein